MKVPAALGGTMPLFQLIVKVAAALGGTMFRDDAGNGVERRVGGARPSLQSRRALGRAVVMLTVKDAVAVGGAKPLFQLIVLVPAALGGTMFHDDAGNGVERRVGQARPSLQSRRALGRAVVMLTVKVPAALGGTMFHDQGCCELSTLG